MAIRTLAELLEQEMCAGHLARRDALAIAQSISEAAWHFVFLEHASDASVAATD